MQYIDTVRILVCYAYHHAANNHFDKSSMHDNHLAHLAFLFLQVAKFFGTEFSDPRMSGKVCQQYDHEAPSCQGPHLIDSMSELTSVGLRTWHFMAVDMLSSVFMSVTNQQREVSKLYRNPRHTAMQWKWAVDQAQRETVNRLSKQLGMQTFVDGQVYPACLRNTPYADYAFPLQGQYYNQPVPYPLTQGLAKVCQSVAPGMYLTDSPTAVTATAQQGPVTEGGQPASCRSPATEMGFTA